MTPQTASFLSAADQALSDARGILSIDIPRQAARLAYYAQFHAAQALIFERTGRVAKTHKGVHRQLHSVARTEVGFPTGFASQLTIAYRYKEIADYDTGAAPPITMIRARDAIATAERFVAAVRQAVSPPPAASAP